MASFALSIVAANEDEARGIGHRLAKMIYPKLDWENHHVAASKEVILIENINTGKIQRSDRQP